MSSLSIFITEKAKDNVTANGKPSGMAITTIETPMMKKSKSLTNCVPCIDLSYVASPIINKTVRATTVKVAPKSPK